MTNLFSQARLPLFCALFLPLALSAQASFRVEIANDTVAVATAFQVRYIVENADVANFQLPNLEHFEQKSNAATAHNISIINGKKSQTTTFTYWLAAKNIGQYELPKLEIPTATGYLTCPPKNIVVTQSGPQNPKNMPQNNPFGDNPFGGNPFGQGAPSFEFPDFGGFPKMDVEQFFNNPQFFNFEFPNLSMPEMPSFNELFKNFDQLFDQQYKSKRPEAHKIDPKTNQPVYKI